MTTNRPSVVIIDIDNCIADDQHRIQHIDWTTSDLTARYAAYHARCEQDRAVIHERIRLQIVPGVTRVFFFTGRPVALNEKTRHWLNIHFPFEWEALLMRNNDDHRPSAKLKQAQLESLLLHHNVELEDIAMAVDDRQDVLDTYRAAGIEKVFHVQLHNGDAYAPPATTVPTLLQDAAQLFTERNAAYGNSYKVHGEVMAKMFPDGITLRTAEDWIRVTLLINATGKLTRYAASAAQGGHQDSAIDAAVYCAMLREMTP